MAFSNKQRQDLRNSHLEAEQLIASFTEALPKEPPSVIYHYTNDVGLHGILETGQLWLTDIFSLNDPSEVSHGFSIAINALSGKVANGTPASKEFARMVADCYQRVGIQGSAQYFTCSFSSSGDDLGQWRAYGGNGNGYALGFDAKALEAEFVRSGFTNAGIPNADSFPITYDDARLAKLDSEIIEFYLRVVDLDLTLQSAVSTQDIAELYTSLTVHLLRAAIFFKHPAYDNEREYRFLQTYEAGDQIPGIKQRPRRHLLIKYREFDWRTIAATTLKEIVVGPAADHGKARQFAEDCLRLGHGGTVPITYSTIPYQP